MTESNPATGNGNTQDTICFAQLDGGVAIIRILGRGSFANSVELKKLTDDLAAKHAGQDYHFIVDLAECSTMDSTFMGVLASVGLRQKRDTGQKAVIVNANPQTLRLMQTLGLAHFIEVRAEDNTASQAASKCDFQTASCDQVSRMDRIVHMIEAHENLCGIDKENNVRFESVLKYLNESLDRERKAANVEDSQF